MTKEQRKAEKKKGCDRHIIKSDAQKAALVKHI